MKSRWLGFLLPLLLVGVPSVMEACTVCMGGNDSQVGPAMNGAIFLLLGCIGGVLGLLVAFAVSLMKRANNISPGAELQEL